MYRIIIWGTGLNYNKYINAVKYQELLGDIQIVGVTGRDKLYDYLDGYPFIPLENVDCRNVDYIVVTSEKYFGEISVMAKALGFMEERVILAKVFGLPMFRFEKYICLLQSKVSIIANNCWGGTVYHALGMKFYSPFINMFLRDNDYINLLHNLKYYSGLRLKFKEFCYSKLLDREYPVCWLGDIELHFNHFINMKDIEKKWYERIGRLNWDNLFIMMYTENKQVLENFDGLNYKNKICFVPFESTLQSACYLQIVGREKMQNIPFWEIVNKTASGYYHDYDLVELLSTGKVNHNRYYLKKEDI